MYQRILVATDGSAPSRKATHAIDLAARAERGHIPVPVLR